MIALELTADVDPNLPRVLPARYKKIRRMMQRGTILSPAGGKFLDQDPLLRLTLHLPAAHRDTLRVATALYVRLNGFLFAPISLRKAAENLAIPYQDLKDDFQESLEFHLSERYGKRYNVPYVNLILYIDIYKKNNIHDDFHAPS